MISVRSVAWTPTVSRGLGRLAEPDLRMRGAQMHPWSRCVVQPGGRDVTLSWVRSVTQGLHSVEVRYDDDAVRIALRMGTRPGFWGVGGLVVLNTVVEHTTIHLREPLRRRPVEMLV